MAKKYNKYKDDYRRDEYQGRTQKQQDSNEAAGAIAVIAFIGILAGIFIYEVVKWAIHK